MSPYSKPNPDFTIYTDTSLRGQGITDEVLLSRELWHKSRTRSNIK